jgi:hypothetical protein
MLSWLAPVASLTKTATQLDLTEAAKSGTPDMPCLVCKRNEVGQIAVSGQLITRPFSHLPALILVRWQFGHERNELFERHGSACNEATSVSVTVTEHLLPQLLVDAVLAIWIWHSSVMPLPLTMKPVEVTDL